MQSACRWFWVSVVLCAFFQDCHAAPLRSSESFWWRTEAHEISLPVGVCWPEFSIESAIWSKWWNTNKHKRNADSSLLWLQLSIAQSILFPRQFFWSPAKGPVTKALLIKPNATIYPPLLRQIPHEYHDKFVQISAWRAKKKEVQPIKLASQKRDFLGDCGRACRWNLQAGQRSSSSWPELRRVHRIHLLNSLTKSLINKVRCCWSHCWFLYVDIRE